MRRILMNRAIWLLVVILAIIGGAALLALIGMWLMHWSMMGGDMMGNGPGR